MSARRIMTDEQREEARRLYATGAYALSSLATKYGVAPRTMGNVLKGIHRPRPRERDDLGRMAWGNPNRRVGGV